jgi:PTS system fructose-specific IIC component
MIFYGLQLAQQITSFKTAIEQAGTVITADTITLNLKGKISETIITELLGILLTQRKLTDQTTALNDLLYREQTMSTAMPNGIALPRAKTNVIRELTI